MNSFKTVLKLPFMKEGREEGRSEGNKKGREREARRRAIRRSSFGISKRTSKAQATASTLLGTQQRLHMVYLMAPQIHSLSVDVKEEAPTAVPRTGGKNWLMFGELPKSSGNRRSGYRHHSCYQTVLLTLAHKERNKVPSVSRGRLSPVIC